MVRETKRERDRERGEGGRTKGIEGEEETERDTERKRGTEIQTGTLQREIHHG